MSGLSREFVIGGVVFAVGVALIELVGTGAAAVWLVGVIAWVLLRGDRS